MGKYFCRLCYNSKNWTEPSGDARETKMTFHGNFGFAWEEWNFDFSNLIDGYKYGWIEGFWSERDGATGSPVAKGSRPTVDYGTHEVILYTYHEGVYQFVGILNEVEHIDQNINTFYGTRQPSASELAALAVQACRFGATVVQHNGDLLVHPASPKSGWSPLRFWPEANVRFRRDAYRGWVPVPTRVVKNPRYRPILVDGNDNFEQDWKRLIGSARPI